MSETTSRQGEPVAFEVVLEQWSKIKIVGTQGPLIDVKPVIIEVRRLDKKDSQGRDVYAIMGVIAARVEPVRVPVTEEGEGDGEANR